VRGARWQTRAWVWSAGAAGRTGRARREHMPREQVAHSGRCRAVVVARRHYVWEMHAGGGVPAITRRAGTLTAVCLDRGCLG